MSDGKRDQLRSVRTENRADMNTLARLHRELLPFGPMAKLGFTFVREVCYGIPMRSDLMRAALFELDGEPLGFIAYTPWSIGFHRSGMGRHAIRGIVSLALALARDPRRLIHLVRAARVLRSRRAEKEVLRDPLGEVVCIGVKPEATKAAFVRRTGIHASRILVEHAARFLRKAGVAKMRMLVDSTNKPALMLYHQLGACFEECDHGGTETVAVWFDLDRTLGSESLEVPEIWRPHNGHVDSDSLDRPETWDEYWEGLSGRQQLFRVESDDFVEKLRASVDIPRDARVLDFGCGFGFIAKALAPHVGKVALWDQAANMRRYARIQCVDRDNIEFLDLRDPDRLPPGDFDLILCNSVAQYMSEEDFAAWLNAWSRMLSDRGQIVLSDLIPPDHRSSADSIDLLAFGAKNRFLIRVISEAFSEMRRYSRMRLARPLRRIGEEEIRTLSSRHGLELRSLPHNLTLRRKRNTIVLSRCGAPAATA